MRLDAGRPRHLGSCTSPITTSFYIQCGRSLRDASKREQQADKLACSRKKSFTVVINAVAVAQERYGPTAKAYPMDVIDILLRKLPAKPYLHEFLAESSVCPPEGPAPKKKNPEYEAHMDAVRAKLEDREYDRCVCVCCVCATN